MSNLTRFLWLSYGSAISPTWPPLHSFAFLVKKNPRDFPDPTHSTDLLQRVASLHGVYGRQPSRRQVMSGKLNRWYVGILLWRVGHEHNTETKPSKIEKPTAKLTNTWNLTNHFWKAFFLTCTYVRYNRPNQLVASNRELVDPWELRQMLPQHRGIAPGK